MTSAKWVFIAYVFLAYYDLGMTWVLQLMHYPLYHNVGAAEFSAYIRANNRKAVFPAILPAVATLASSILLFWQRVDVVTTRQAIVAVALNVVVLLSTAVWQGRLHRQLAETGKSETTVAVLVRTNWIRTGAFTAQAALALQMLTEALTVGV